MRKMIRERCTKIRSICEQDTRSTAEFLLDVYRDNKNFILSAVFFCLLFSLLNCVGGGYALAQADAENAAATLGGSFGAMAASVIGTGIFEGIDVSWTMTIIAVASLVNKFALSVGFPGLSILRHYSFGIFESIVVCIAMLIFYGLPLLLKCFSKTTPIAVSIENTLKNWTGVLVAVIVISQMFTAAPSGDTANAASLGTPGYFTGTLAQGLTAALCFALLIITLILYFLIRYLFNLIDIIMIPVTTFVPFVSLLTVIAKFLLICFLLFLASVAPALFTAIVAVIVIISVLLFRTAYLAGRYFKNIYTKPLFKKIFGGYDPSMPLVSAKIPSKIRSYLNGETPDLAIPVYLLKKPLQDKSLHRWDRCFLISKGGEHFLLKSSLFRRDCVKVPVQSTDEKKIFINRSVFYNEIFAISGSEDCLTRMIRKIPKESHIVFSKEYHHRYDDIQKSLGLVELSEYTQFLKQNMPKKEGFFSKIESKA